MECEVCTYTQHIHIHPSTPWRDSVHAMRSRRRSSANQISDLQLSVLEGFRNRSGVGAGSARANISFLNFELSDSQQFDVLDDHVLLGKLRPDEFLTCIDFGLLS